ncbi:MAG: MFS transporter [Chloroflexota bacterium]
MRPLLNNLTLWSLTLGHFSVDMLSGAMPIIVGLYLSDSLQLDLTQIGFTLAVFKLTSSLTQPLFGYLSDRYGGRWFAVGGVFWMSLFLGMAGFMTTFQGALLMIALCGFGTAAFHPQGASGANRAAGELKTSGVAMFMLGGNVGFALGPILAAFVLGTLGTQGTVLLALVGIFIAPMIYLLTGRIAKEPAAEAKPANWKIQLNPLFTTTAIMALFSVMSLRAWSHSSFSSFMPQYFAEVANFTKADASLLSSLMLFVLAFGTLTGGMLSDRIGGTRVMRYSLLAAAPLMFLIFTLGDRRAFLVAPFLGFAAGAAWPPMLVMAQTLFHKNAGVGTGMALGFVFAIGGLGLNLTGWLAEPQNLGFQQTMLLLSVVPLVTAALVGLLPTREVLEQPGQSSMSVKAATVKG